VIADNGHGIFIEHHQRIFQPFFTTKEECGTGLGWLSQKRLLKDIAAKYECGATYALAETAPSLEFHCRPRRNRPSHSLSCAARMRCLLRQVYFTESSSVAPVLAEVSAAGGETAPIAVPIELPQLLDVSREESELLMAGSTARQRNRSYGWLRCRGKAHIGSEMFLPGMLRGRGWTGDGVREGHELYRRVAMRDD
jgi:hypothetical protein